MADVGTDARDKDEQKRVSYDVTRNEADELVKVVSQPRGDAIPIDANNQGFCDFLTWASHQSVPIGTPPPVRDPFRHGLPPCCSSPLWRYPTL